MLPISINLPKKVRNILNKRKWPSLWGHKEILKHLLELNHQIHEEEVRKGLWDKKKAGKKEYPTKGFDPGSVVKEDEGGYGQGKLF